ncbi:hypothetical protein BU23DRAFT_604536 [Bimuria novae-zelandiae CBS 107.79]|uniref:Uncharacterized protein n=1 Tax=Bimuria novae-zelandiae CBS 107.79 TaxID=1447943 RepID=A0A6A5UV56_9PLEO|nr:hypothetical protein BU23DRAFT_604536 [Bimuria novae-zelandiae CBS 107.79]
MRSNPFVHLLYPESPPGSQDRPSRLRTHLPARAPTRELREKVYFYLGFPVAGYCLHDCEKLFCYSYRNRHKVCRGDYPATIDEWRLQKANVQPCLLEVTWACAHEEENRKNVLIGIEVCAENQPGGPAPHYFTRLPNLELMHTSWFFYHDILACFTWHGANCDHIRGVVPYKSVIQNPGGAYAQAALKRRLAIARAIQDDNNVGVLRSPRRRHGKVARS